MTLDEKIDSLCAESTAILARMDAIEERMITISATTQRIMDALAGGRAASAPTASGGAARPAAGSFRFGRQKGQPLSDGTGENLTWYRDAIMQSIADPAKAQYLDSNRAHLAEVEAAMGLDPPLPF